MFSRLIFALSFIIFLSCSKDKPLYEPKAKNNGYEIYKEAFKAFENGIFYAQKNLQKQS